MTNQLQRQQCTRNTIVCNKCKGNGPSSNLAGDTYNRDDTKLHQLPNEIMSLILHHLAKERKTLFQCTLVTTKFYAIVIPLLWQAPIYSNNDMSRRFLACVSDTSQQRLEILGQHIRELRLHGSRWTDADLSRLIPHMPQLNHLSVYQNSSITDTSFQHVPYQCQYITCLELFFTPLTLASSFSAIGQHCHRLLDFRWYLSDNQSPEWLELLTSCPLESLVIFSAQKPLTTKGITIIKKWNRLTRLEIIDTTPGLMKSLLLPSPPPGNNNNNTNTTASWPRLSELKLSPCDTLDDTTLMTFFKSHPCLERLELWYTQQLTDTTLDAMATWLPHLTLLTIAANDNVTPDGIRRLVRQCSSTQLQNITLFLCHKNIANAFQETSTRTDKTVLDGTKINKIRQDVMHGKRKKQSSID